jgi:hypothetical protein
VPTQGVTAERNTRGGAARKEKKKKKKCAPEVERA